MAAWSAVIQGMTVEHGREVMAGLRRLVGLLPKQSEKNEVPANEILTMALFLGQIMTRVASESLKNFGRFDALIAHAVSKGLDGPMFDCISKLYLEHIPDLVVLNGDENPSGTVMALGGRPGVGIWPGYALWKRELNGWGIPQEKIFAAEPGAFTHIETVAFLKFCQENKLRRVIVVTAELQLLRTICTWVGTLEKAGFFCGNREGIPRISFVGATVNSKESVYGSVGAEEMLAGDLAVENNLKLFQYAIRYPEQIATFERVCEYLDWANLDKS